MQTLQAWICWLRVQICMLMFRIVMIFCFYIFLAASTERVSTFSISDESSKIELCHGFTIFLPLLLEQHLVCKVKFCKIVHTLPKNSNKLQCKNVQLRKWLSYGNVLGKSMFKHQTWCHGLSPCLSFGAFELVRQFSY